MISNCPGSQAFKQPTPESIECPSCKREMEIWTDEIQIKCCNCGAMIMRKSSNSCLDWCSFAKECVGERAYNNYMKEKLITLKDKLLEELEIYFDRDEKRINHAKKVMGFAEKLLMQERAQWHIVIPASILHDVGIKIAEEKYGSSAGNYQEKEGPAVAQKILESLSFKKEDIDQICQIIAHHHTPGVVNSLNFKVLYDSDWLVNLKDEVDLNDKVKMEKLIDKVFLTENGKRLARQMYLSNEDIT